jgi:hypothetical protein
MCTVSFAKETLNITICNLYPDIELTSLVYFSDCTACHVSPDQQIDTDSTMVASFGIGSEQYYFKGALLYKLQRKHSSRVSIKETAASMYLLVVWDIGWYVYGFYVRLIECTNDFTWDENKLWALHDQYKYEFRKTYKDSIITWLMNDSTLMKTKFDVIYGSDYKLDIIISEGTLKHDTKEPIQFDLKRLVLSL